MTLLVFGRTGQVATELARRAPDARYLGRAEVDLADPQACGAAIETHAPSAVINAAAFTDVDGAEAAERAAFQVNAEAPGAMARACAARAIPFVHLSTEYVFGGEGQAAFDVGGPLAPLNAYGRSKRAGEDAVRAAGGAYAIIRTSWVISAHGRNFVKTMLRLGAERARIDVVADQIGGPTPAADLAAFCLHVADALAADPAKSGAFHFSGAPDVSWADLAREIFAQSGLDCAVQGIATADFPTAAARPLNSRLDNSLTKTTFGYDRPDWRAGLAGILTELGARKS